MTSEIKSNWLTKQLDKIFDDKCLFSKSGTQQRGPGFLGVTTKYYKLLFFKNMNNVEFGMWVAHGEGKFINVRELQPNLKNLFIKNNFN